MRRALAGLVGVLLVAAGPAAGAGSWRWPLGDGLPPDVVRGFDPPATRYGAGHRGVDLAGAPGDVVRAAGAGRVSYAGLLAGRGVLVVAHGDLRTTYEPVRAAVGVGAEVAAGDVVGTLDAGHPGCRAAACLHWGLRRGEDYLDPLALVGRGPVRLLPLGPGPAAGGSGPPAPASAGAAVPRAQPASEEAAPQAEPSTSLRSAVAPAGGVGAVVLLAVLGLLHRRERRRTPPRDPDPAASAALRGPAPLPPSAPAAAAEVVDLARERAARRPAA